MRTKESLCIIFDSGVGEGGEINEEVRGKKCAEKMSETEELSRCS